MSPIKKIKGKVIPDSIHKMRIKNWGVIRAQELMHGDGLRRALAIKEIVRVFKKLKETGKLTPKRLHNQAKAIDIMLTFLADEYLEAKGRQNATAEEWNKTYLGFFRTIHKAIPIELQREIFRQIREE